MAQDNGQNELHFLTERKSNILSNALRPIENAKSNMAKGTLRYWAQMQTLLKQLALKLLLSLSIHNRDYRLFFQSE